MRALDLAIELGRAGLDGRMLDALVLDVPLELGLELMAGSGADLTNAEREGRDQVVDELDGVGLRVALVDPESAAAGVVVNGGVTRKRRIFWPSSPMKVRNLTSIWMWRPGTCLLYLVVWTLRTRVPPGSRLSPWRRRMRVRPASEILMPS